MQVLFCGEEFAGAYDFTKQAMQAVPNAEVRIKQESGQCYHAARLMAVILEASCTSAYGWQVVNCKREALAEHIGSAHVAVPMMSRLDADMLRRGKQLKLVLQFGVGVEGIDIPTVQNNMKCTL